MGYPTFRILALIFLFASGVILLFNEPILALHVLGLAIYSRVAANDSEGA